LVLASAIFDMLHNHAVLSSGGNHSRPIRAKIAPNKFLGTASSAI